MAAEPDPDRCPKAKAPAFHRGFGQALSSVLRHYNTGLIKLVGTLKEHTGPLRL
jgi:hypothetical protein